MNSIYGNFCLKMELPKNDEDGELTRQEIDERLKAAENILKAAAGIEMTFEWEEIQ